MQLIPYILKHTQLPEKGISNTVALHNQDTTVENCRKKIGFNALEMSYYPVKSS
ncbi:MAG: hypothetical protein WBM98_01920 [Maribacter sp.]|uniref:hypothetical protein n=1 Tax=Maribacter sp. TaxID=1897614 RepID=UPI003C7226EE